MLNKQKGLNVGVNIKAERTEGTCCVVMGLLEDKKHFLKHDSFS